MTATPKQNTQYCTLTPEAREIADQLEQMHPDDLATIAKMIASMIALRSANDRERAA